MAATALVMLLGLLPAGALAEEAGGSTEPAPYATVELSGVVILRVREAGGWESVWARAEEIYRRINEAINQYGSELSPDMVTIASLQTGPALHVGEHLIVTVDEASARSNGASPETLARVWAANLKKALDRYLAVNSPAYPPVF
ncbi:MAG: hypothetical protein IMX02_05295 [Limnochordaceae bacterium]|nr:hypothetical protein [Limnochordaceae bacterium]